MPASPSSAIACTAPPTTTAGPGPSSPSSTICFSPTPRCASSATT
jgi:hypothetical protein